MSERVFANHAPDALQRDALVQWLARSSDAGLWVLIDAALLDNDRVLAFRQRRKSELHNAYAGSPLVAFGDHAPHALALPRDDAALASDVARLLSLAGDAPALSWLRSSAPLSTLQSMFSYLAKVRIAERKAPVHCRFADTRVLPALLRALSEPQRRRVSRVVEAWAWTDRHGALETWTPGTAETAEPDAEAYLQLSPDQFRRMQRASEADGMCMLLSQKTPELVPATRRSGFHRRLKRSLDAADALHVEGTQDRLQFLVLCLTAGYDFHRMPELQATWAALVLKQTSLRDAMGQWDDQVWAALEGKRR